MQIFSDDIARHDQAGLQREAAEWRLVHEARRPPAQPRPLVPNRLGRSLYCALRAVAARSSAGRTC